MVATIEEIYNSPLVQELLMENEKLKKSQDLEKDVTLPYIVKNRTLMSPGIANEIKFTKESIIRNYKGHKLGGKSKGTPLVLDHADEHRPDRAGGVRAWVGEIKNITCTDGGYLKGDLHIVEKATAIKVAYGAKFGISPCLRMSIEEAMLKKAENFKVENFSIVINNSSCLRCLFQNF